MSSSVITEIIKSIKPFDELEAQHITETLAWVASGAQLYRIKKPDIPNKHLVAYAVVVDPAAQKILLVDHKKSGLWLPPGGHVDINEHPRHAAIRECLEELGVTAKLLFEEPMFLSTVVTVGSAAGHTDVDIWYVMQGNCQDTYKLEHDEFSMVEWFNFDEIPFATADLHMQRFVTKLIAELI